MSLYTGVKNSVNKYAKNLFYFVAMVHATIVKNEAFQK